jgi:DNA-binding NarL/FixJ family response regulator
MTGLAVERIRVGVVDDHAVVRDGTAALLDREPDIQVVGVAATIESATALLKLRPNVLVVDIRLGQENGFTLLRGLSTEDGPAIVILTSFDYPQFVDAALRLGASGYVLKTDPFENLVRAIRQVAAGGFAYSARPSSADVLRPSTRELDVVALVVEGRSNDEIAGQLGISVKTVESHLTRIYERAHVATRTELTARAIREGWLEAAENDRERP